MEPSTSNNNINAINNVRMLLNELRSNVSFEEINRIRKNSIKKKLAVIFLKKKSKKII